MSQKTAFFVVTDMKTLNLTEVFSFSHFPVPSLLAAESGWIIGYCVGSVFYGSQDKIFRRSLKPEAIPLAFFLYLLPPRRS
jgi:hypothetical protein